MRLKNAERKLVEALQNRVESSNLMEGFELENLIHINSGLTRQDTMYALLEMYVELNNKVNRMKQDMQDCYTDEQLESLRKKYCDEINETVKEAPISKLEQRYRDMRAGKIAPALKKDIDTEKILLLRRQGLSYEKIAETVGLSKTAVRNRLKAYKPDNSTSLDQDYSTIKLNL